MSKVLGIDLGTTNSCMAIMEGGAPKVIKAEDYRTTPSIVAFTKDGTVLVGTAAKRQAITNPQNTIYSVKRLMGRRYDDVSGEMKKVPYKIVRAKNGDAAIEVCGKVYSPEEISAMILKKLKEEAEKYLGEPVTQAVITVPAYFDNTQREATKVAGRIAGLDVLRVISEPTAAALAYGFEKNKEETIAMYDLGGGTFDISIVAINDGNFEVKATNGDTRLGGDDFDQVIMDWVVGEFKKEQGIDLSKDCQAIQRLKEAVEKTKCELSTTQRADNINLPFITADASGPKHLLMTLTKEKLESLCGNLIERTGEPCRKCKDDANVQAVNEVVLVGGMTFMPKVQEMAKSLFNKEPRRDVDPNEVVAMGAAVQSGILNKEVTDIKEVIDVTPLTLGITLIGDVMSPLIHRNSTIPTKGTNIYSTVVDYQTNIKIEVLQGESERASKNELLDAFDLDGIPPAPAGVPKIEVTFSINVDGILNVVAKNLDTGREKDITITKMRGLSAREITHKVEEVKAKKIG